MFFKSLFGKKKSVKSRAKNDDKIIINNEKSDFKNIAATDSGFMENPDSRKIITEINETDEITNKIKQEIKNIYEKEEQEEVLDEQSIIDLATQIKPIIEEKISAKEIVTNDDFKAEVLIATHELINPKPLELDSIPKVREEEFNEILEVNRPINKPEEKVEDKKKEEPYQPIREDQEGNSFIVNDKGEKISATFKDKIVDFKGDYLKIKHQELYYLYKLDGTLIDRNGYLDIELGDDYYIVFFDSDKYVKLDIRKYKDLNFKLTKPIDLDRTRYESDYKVKKYGDNFQVKVESRGETYDIDGISGDVKLDLPNLESAKVIDSEPKEVLEEKVEPEILELKPENPVSELEIEPGDLEEHVIEVVPPTSYFEEPLRDEVLPPQEEALVLEEQIKDLKLDLEPQEEKTDEVKVEKIKEEKKEEKEHNTVTIDFRRIDLKVQDTAQFSTNELKKEELEDKNYEVLEDRINYLLNELQQLRLNIKDNDRERLNLEIQKLESLKLKVKKQKANDIESEKQALEQAITNSELFSLEQILQKKHLENQMDLNEHLLNRLEDLDFMNKSKADKIEKALLKAKLKRASDAVEVSSIIFLPFVKSKYLLYFVMGLFVSKHLNFFHNTLKHKTEEYIKDDFSELRIGRDALDSALFQVNDNLNYLNLLAESALKKFPELSMDSEYMFYLNNLRANLLLQQEKMLRKKKVLKKYDIDTKSYVRIREKDKKAA